MGLFIDALNMGLPWALLAVVAHYLVSYMMYFDLNKRVYNHVPGQCQTIAGIEDGAEDVEVLANGLAVFTAGLKLYPSPELNSTIKGKVYLYNFTGNTAWELTMNAKGRMSTKTFNPHGITSWTMKKSGKSKTFIYIINHHPRGDRVEVFLLDIEQKAINHTKTIRDKALMVNLNGIAAIGTDKFYVTNFHYFNQSWARNVELFLGLKVGSILFYNGTSMSYAERWVKSPSGIALDKSRRYLYVSAMLAERIEIYRIDSYSNGSISLHDTIDLNSSPENIFSDPVTGDLWVACHPVKFRYFTHETRPKTVMSPTQILQLKGRPTRQSWAISEVFASDGATLSGGSVAVRFKDQILIGSLHDKLLKCDLIYPELY